MFLSSRKDLIACALFFDRNSVPDHVIERVVGGGAPDRGSGVSG